MLPRRVNTQSEDYKQKRAGMLKALQRLEKELEISRQEGRPTTIARHKAQGKFTGRCYLWLHLRYAHFATARERINLLLDEDSPFLELCALAGMNMKGMVSRVRHTSQPFLNS